MESVIPSSVSWKIRRGPGSTGTWFGTTRTVHPAASADRAPVFESSIARVRSGSTPSNTAAFVYGSGWLAWTRDLWRGDEDPVVRLPRGERPVSVEP